MCKVKLNHEHPAVKEARYIKETRQLTYQQRFEKMMAIIGTFSYIEIGKKSSQQIIRSTMY